MNKAQELKALATELVCPVCGSDCNERDELVKAEREIERLTKDAERYRWLRNESWACYNINKRKPQVAETVVFVADGAGNVKTVLAEKALDVAIDAAIAAGLQTEGPTL